MSSAPRFRPRAPLLPAAVAMVAGVLAGRMGLDAGSLAAPGFALAAAGAAACRGLHGVARLLLLLALGSLGASRAAARMPDFDAAHPREEHTLEACLEGLTRVAGVPGAGGVFTGDAWARLEAGEPRRLRLLLPTEEGARAPARGTRIRLRGAVRRAPPPSNPGEPDPRIAEADAGLDGSVSAIAWTVVGRCRGGAVARLLDSARSRFRARVEAVLPPAEAGLASALAVGIQDGVDPSDFDAFQATGTVHVLSVSGMHLALVTGGVFLVAQGLAVSLRRRHGSARDPRIVAASLGLAAATAYAALAGLSLATARALVATLLVCAAALFGGRSSAWNGWALGLAGILFVDPASVRSSSLALSFLAVAGILAAGSAHPHPRFRVSGSGVGAWLAAVLRRARDGARVWPAGTLRVTAGAAAATAPVVAFRFGRVPALGLVANAAAIPLFSFALVPLLCAVLALPVSPGAADLLIRIAGPALRAGRAVVHRLAETPLCWLDVSFPAPGAAALAAAVFCALLLRGPLRRFAVSLSVALAAIAVLHRAPPPGSLEVTFLAVGQGDAALVRFGGGGVLLVDAGPEPAGRRVIVPHLRALGIRRIDVIAISHAHPDHTGGLADVVRAFPVGELWLAGPVGADPGLEAARGPLAMRGTRIVGEGAGRPARGLGTGRIDLLAGNPSLRDERPGERSGRNDRSLVLRVSDATLSVLFTGDLEQAGESELVRSGAFLGATVVKAPHHGSGTSSGAPLVRAAAPRLVVGSTGRENRFGFPAPEVVGRWRAAGASWLDTARSGAIRVRSCGPAPEAGVCVRTFAEPGRDVRY